MASLELVQHLAAADHGLAVAVTIRADGTPQASVVNGGVLPHPIDHEPIVAFVARGRSAKLAHLRARPYVSLTFRAGWEWVVVEGAVTLAGPEDPCEGLDADGIRLLLREIFLAAGGTHDDFDEYDRVMVEDGRTAVLVRPDRIATNPPGREHVEQ
jgi:PPOX class probable F420-dependent enzyme